MVSMPWMEKTVEQSRKGFIAEAQQKEKSMRSLCREYGITRKTGYKWLERFQNGEALCDKSHCRKSFSNKTDPGTEALILSAREKHPTWGARKLKRHLENQGYAFLPAQSTICEILKRNGCITEEASEAHTPYRRFEQEKPNGLWQMDFKGDFAMLNGQRCFPLTLLDDHSRFCLCLDAKENQRTEGFCQSFERLLMEFGLPNAILCDNGKPWGDSHSGYTSFDVWMMQLGILPIHIRPLHPQTQGKEERFHRTLKEDLILREVFMSCQDAQKKFEPFRYEYNHERPHAALNMDTPAMHYRESGRRYDPSLKEPEYDSGANLRKVNYKGYISIRRKRYFFSDAFIGKYLEIREQDDDVFSLFYGNFEVAKLDIQEGKFLTRKAFHRADSLP
jgi:transposase InsO family protein